MINAFPPVSELPASAAGSLLGVFSKLSELRQPRLASWAEALSDALLTRLLAVTTGVQRDGETVAPLSLAGLDAAEAEGLHQIIVVAAGESQGAALAWLKELGRMVTADFERRVYEQAVIDAMVDMIDAEEQRLARESRPPTDLSGLPPWSEVSEPPE